MKKILIALLFLTIFLFYNCKNTEKQPEELAVPEDIKTEDLKEIDSSKVLEPYKTINDTEAQPNVVHDEAIKVKETNKDVSSVVKKETIAVKEETTTTVITKTDTEIVKPDTETIIEEETKVITSTPVETETETVTEPTVTEPIVKETPKEVVANNWVVPVKYKTLKNPTDPKEDLTIGKNLYSKHCKSCHGSEGYGDGPKSDEMDGDLGDFSSEEFQSQSDGSLFYKTTFGRDDMPEYTKKMPDDEDRWLVVNYMRTLAE